MEHFRQNAATQLGELEGVAQTHYHRANTLADELTTAQGEILELRHQVRTVEYLSTNYFQGSGAPRNGWCYA